MYCSKQYMVVMAPQLYGCFRTAHRLCAYPKPGSKKAPQIFSFIWPLISDRLEHTGHVTSRADDRFVWGGGGGQDQLAWPTHSMALETTLEMSSSAFVPQMTVVSTCHIARMS